MSKSTVKSQSQQYRIDAESHELMKQYRNPEIDPVVGTHFITESML